jgi:hypothetical protein
MSYAKLEEVAAGISPLLPKAAGHRRGPWMIDGWRVLEQTLPRIGFNYHLADEKELEDCAAFTIPEEKLVVLRQDVYQGLFKDDVFSRSTVVHELAHIALNHAVTLYRGAVLGKHQFCEDSEWQAKALTAAILMPVDACKAAMSARELASMCGTSEESAGYRIQKLLDRNLLDPNRFGGGLF